MKEILQTKVQRYRVKRSLTQEELAQKLGVTRQTIIAIEKGSYAPSVILALKLAKVFKTKVEELFQIKHER